MPTTLHPPALTRRSNLVCRALTLGPIIITLAVLMLYLTTTAVAAAPHIIVITGDSLSHPVVLSDWNQNNRFMASFVDGEIIKSENLKDRPYLEVSLFWGSEWQNYVKAGHSLSDLNPTRGNQQGRLYLATNRAPAAVSLNGLFARKLNDDGISVLAQQGIHVASNSVTSPRSIGRVIVISSLSLVCIVVLFLYFTRNRHPLRVRIKA